MVVRMLVIWFVMLVAPLSTVNAAQDAAPPGVTPVGIRIPQALVDTVIEPLAIPGGVPEEPHGTWVVGWYGESGGIAPGNVPILYAYREFRGVGPAAFYLLDQLGPGDGIELTGADGVAYQYQVTQIDTYDVATSSPDVIFTPTGAEQLMLFTYGGPYLPSTGFATIVMVRAALVDSSNAAPVVPTASPSDCQAAPRELDLASVSVPTVTAPDGSREALSVADAVPTDPGVVAEIDGLIRTVTSCDVVVRSALTLPDGRVLALLGPSDPLDLANLLSTTTFSAIATDPAATAMELVLFVPTEGSWQAAPVPWS